jgi:hypothetical protein
MPKASVPQFNYRYTGLIDLRNILQAHLDPRELVASCVTCKNFNPENEHCGISGPPTMRPPAKVIAFGCPAYADNDDIPF